MAHTHILSLGLLFFSFFACTFAAKTSDLVQHLPGWNEPLFTKFYAGHIGIQNETKFLTYMFVEASNNSSPETPLVLWMQGGPGASGFMGMFTELGPFNLNEFSYDPNGPPKLLYNPHSWTNNAHFIFFESPAGVGYTYCNGPCPHNTDETAAADAYDFLLKFFEEFSEFKENPFFIAGESYGGIYIPMLAEEIMDNENKINLKGVLVGNGCTGLKSIGGCGPDSKMTLLSFLHGHGQISTKSYKFAQEKCTSSMDSEECQSAIKSATSEAGKFFEYNLYDECKAYEANKDEAPSVTPYDYPCFQDQALGAWMTHPDVKNMFRVEQSWITHDGYWDLYTSTKDNVLPIYTKMLSKGISVLIFYGDTDPGVPYNGGQKWIASLDMEVKSDWRPWTLNGDEDVVGYITEYEGNFKFVTVRGAGHMVPLYKPQAALTMFECFIFGHPFPIYYKFL